MTAAAPTINSVLDGGDQASAILNVTGAGTVQLYYRKSGAAAWTTGLTKDCIVSGSLELRYKMEDNLATTQVLDSSGNGYHGTSVRNTALIHASGGGFEFNGSTDYVAASNSVNVSGNDGISLSVRYKKTDTTSGIVFGSSNSPLSGEIRIKIYSSGQLDCWIVDVDDNSIDIVSNIGEVSLNTWETTSLVIEKINDTNCVSRLYHNGNLIISHESSLFDLEELLASLTDNGKVFWIGACDGLGVGIEDQEEWLGFLKDFRIYSKALVAEEALTVHNSGGDITQTGLESGWYEFYATDTVDGQTSAPSAMITFQIADVAVAATAVNEFDQAVITASSEIRTLMGESIVYLPAGGGSRSILAIIDRNGQASLPGIPVGNAPETVITVMNDSTTGISSAEIDTGGDKVTLALRRGKLPQTRRITKILSEDAGMLMLEVR